LSPYRIYLKGKREALQRNAHTHQDSFGRKGTLGRVHSRVSPIRAASEDGAVRFYVDAEAFAGFFQAVDKEEGVHLAFFGGVAACRDTWRNHGKMTA